MQIGAYEESIFPGDSTDRWIIKRLDAAGAPYNLAAYSCQLIVEDLAINRPVNTMSVDNLSFITGLDPADTDGATYGSSYKCHIVLSNAALVPPYQRTHEVWVHVPPQT